ncbi:MAG: protein translocase subunit SecD [Gammaproteobacteria bacterium]|nr:protein translocase subunit SecD [Gammaproteobacteria bacterium]
MLNQYPLWKYLLLIVFVAVGVIYTLPNLYGDDPSLQISATRMQTVDATTRDKVAEVLKAQQIEPLSYTLGLESLLVRFANTDDQIKAYSSVREALGRSFVVALNLAPATPDWLRSFNALPMYLGLDLRGGVHFLMGIDMEAAIASAVARYTDDVRTLLRDEKVRYLTVESDERNDRVEIKFRDQETLTLAEDRLRKDFRELTYHSEQRGDLYFLYLSLSEAQQREVRQFALKQNITTLRNRVNELGVAEPVIQQQGDERIVVQLPGIQDTARAKEILGATATLEYHMVDEEHDLQSALAGRVPPGSRIYHDRNGQPVLLYKRVVITGDQVTDAASGLDPQSGGPLVSVTLDSKGARRMSNNTRENVGKRMAVVYIETKTETRMVNGEPERSTERIEEVISVAVIREHFSKRFQTSGLDSSDEARNLALLLRAGALAAPIEILEERTIGPSLGQDNIDKGLQSVVIGFLFVIVFMVVKYRLFGMIANAALAFNVVMIVAVLSMLQATLTLPGIAGIVLTVGMAVDANVLIFERIREELRSGNTPQASIHAGYEKAFSTIADANITTLIAALVLFGFGTGPVKGFAITLSIGIITSMITAIMGTRAIVNLTLGGKRLQKLSI